MSSSAREPAAREPSRNPCTGVSLRVGPRPARSAAGGEGHTAYYGRVGPRRVRKIVGKSAARRLLVRVIIERTEPRPILPCSPRVDVWYGSEGLHQAVAPAIGV